jgi:hypothetical protein
MDIGKECLQHRVVLNVSVAASHHIASHQSLRIESALQANIHALDLDRLENHRIGFQALQQQRHAALNLPLSAHKHHLLASQCSIVCVLEQQRGLASAMRTSDDGQVCVVLQKWHGMVDDCLQLAIIRVEQKMVHFQRHCMQPTRSNQHTPNQHESETEQARDTQAERTNKEPTNKPQATVVVVGHSEEQAASSQRHV